MPLYEYACDSCGKRFERIQKFSDPPVAVCPDCGAPVRKLISSPAIQFKGSGWYITDYARSGGSDKGASKDSAAKESSSSASTDSSASKSADATSAPSTASSSSTTSSGGSGTKTKK